MNFMMLYLQLQKLHPKKLTLTVVEKQLLSDNEKNDSKEEIACLELTNYKNGRKKCVNIKTDTDKLNNVVYLY